MEYWNNFEKENGKLTEALDELGMVAVLKMDVYPATISIFVKTDEEQMSMLSADKSQEGSYIIFTFGLNETVMEMGKKLTMTDKSFKRLARMAKSVYLAYTTAYHAECVSKC